MEQGQAKYREKGMVRSAVLVDSAVTRMQFERLAKQSGIYEWERYFSADEPDHDERMTDWLQG